MDGRTVAAGAAAIAAGAAAIAAAAVAAAVAAGVTPAATASSSAAIMEHGISPNMMSRAPVRSLKFSYSPLACPAREVSRLRVKRRYRRISHVFTRRLVDARLGQQSR